MDNWFFANQTPADTPVVLLKSRNAEIETLTSEEVEAVNCAVEATNESSASHIVREEAIDGFAPTLRSLIEKLPLSVRARLTAKLAHLKIDKSIDSPAVRGVVEFAVQAYDKKRASARESSAKRRLQTKKSA